MSSDDLQYVVDCYTAPRLPTRSVQRSKYVITRSMRSCKDFIERFDHILVIKYCII